MRILVVSPVLPHLPSRDAARLAPSHLVERRLTWRTVAQRHEALYARLAQVGLEPAA